MTLREQSPRQLVGGGDVLDEGESVVEDVIEGSVLGAGAWDEVGGRGSGAPLLAVVVV